MRNIALRLMPTAIPVDPVAGIVGDGLTVPLPLAAFTVIVCEQFAEELASDELTAPVLSVRIAFAVNVPGLL